ncbi:DUF1365 domain-containing protein [Pseudooceanicola sp. C21-150M6]|uniref:DUF1365 domain-containing protein n=1 Tax=Pseudooceanicola sp. C21-150M6 TaxID=3434355 RepID=UPI003D7FAF39
MTNLARPLHLRGQTWHGRKGQIRNAFRYGVDYVLLDAENDGPRPRLFSRNRGNLTSLHDSDHGGPPKEGRGAAWVREVLAEAHLPRPARIRLLTQPRVLGHVFNPVSFWLCEDDRGDLRVVIAEVTNTFGDRHSYLCHRDDQGPIGPKDVLSARKVLHVSPFQPQTGTYAFTFDITDQNIRIRIDYDREAEGGLIATLTGPLEPLTNRAILGACLRRPFGSRRVLALIHWQALKLFIKRARYRNRPPAPATEVSR